MAEVTTNGDVDNNNRLETAEAFAENFVKKELAKSVEERLSSYEQETADLNICNKEKSLEELFEKKFSTFEQETGDLNISNNKDDAVNADVKIEEVDTQKVETIDPEKEVVKDSPPAEVNVTVSESSVGEDLKSAMVESPETIVDAEIHHQVEENVDSASGVEHVNVPQVKIETVETIDQTSMPECPISVSMPNDVQQSETNPVIDDECKVKPSELEKFEDAVADVNETVDSTCPKMEPIIQICPAKLEDQIVEPTKPIENGHHDLTNGIEDKSPICASTTVTNGVEEEKPTITNAMEQTDLSENRSEEEKSMRRNFKKMGINENWWKEKPTIKDGINDNVHEKESEKQSFDKFQTIKQNIKRGNTRSLKERFENLFKLNE